MISFKIIKGFEGRNQFPRQLSAKDEAECIRKIAEGDDSARDKLIVHNLRLVAYIVKKNYPDARDQDDLISILYLTASRGLLQINKPSKAGFTLESLLYYIIAFYLYKISCPPCFFVFNF